MLIDNIESLYHSYLLNLDDPDEYDGYHRASSSGMCIKALFYRKYEFEKKENNAKTMRIFRLGTLVHQDIQAAMPNAIIEKEVKDENLKLKGHIDLYTTENDVLEIVDIKTIGSFPYKMKFGRNPDKNPSFHQEMQVGIYTYMLSKELNLDPYKTKMYEAKISMLYYNKDNSGLKIKIIDNHFIDMALDYWSHVKDYEKVVTKENIEEIFSLYQPPTKWSCNYCNYSEICPLGKKEK